MNSDKRFFKQPVGNSTDCDEQDLVQTTSWSCTDARTHTDTNTVSHHSSSDVSNPVAYPGILFERGVQQIQLRTEDRENGYLGAVAP